MKVDTVHIIFSVIKDIRVIGTVVVAFLIIEFAHFVTSYKKKPPKPKRPKPAKAAPAPAPAPKPEAESEAPAEE